MSKFSYVGSRDSDSGAMEESISGAGGGGGGGGCLLCADAPNTLASLAVRRRVRIALAAGIVAGSVVVVILLDSVEECCSPHTIGRGLADTLGKLFCRNSLLYPFCCANCSVAFEGKSVRASSISPSLIDSMDLCNTSKLLHSSGSFRRWSSWMLLPAVVGSAVSVIENTSDFSSIGVTWVTLFNVRCNPAAGIISGYFLTCRF